MRIHYTLRKITKMLLYENLQGMSTFMLFVVLEWRMRYFNIYAGWLIDVIFPSSLLECLDYDIRL